MLNSRSEVLGLHSPFLKSKEVLSVLCLRGKGGPSVAKEPSTALPVHVGTRLYIHRFHSAYVTGASLFVMMS